MTPPLRILQFGRTGQLARAMLARAPYADVRLTALGRGQADLSVPGEAARAVERARADLVLIAAAHTAVDRAETEPRLARRVNAAAPGEIAAACAARGLPLVHISTDYVYSGAGDQPFKETDPIAPLGVYGMTKAEGEAAALAANPKTAILRTSWVFSPWGGNFVKTMLRLARDRDTVRVVADQTGRPTSAADLAGAILAMAPRLVFGEGPYGVFHFANAGAVSWAGFAEGIFTAARARGLPAATVTPIATKDFPTPAKRPAWSVLDTSKIESAYGIAPRPWTAALDEAIGALS